MLGTDWDPLLRQEFEKPYWAELQAFVEKERLCYEVFPPHDEVFTALRLTPFPEREFVSKAHRLGSIPKSALRREDRVLGVYKRVVRIVVTSTGRS